MSDPDLVDSLHLVVGNKNYSSWSLRPWFLMRHSGIEFDEIRLPLGTVAFRDGIGSHSPTRLVPVLRHQGLVVWDSLAICEYLSDLLPALRLWPSERKVRALARSMAAEMHSGFAALREHLPMNCRATGRKPRRTEAVERDLQRIEAIWTECRERFGVGGPWLFGRFSIADAMFAPVASRFATYGVELASTAAEYRDTVLGTEAFGEWLAAARAETETIQAVEVG